MGGKRQILASFPPPVHCTGNDVRILIWGFRSTYRHRVRDNDTKTQDTNNQKFKAWRNLPKEGPLRTLPRPFSNYSRPNCWSGHNSSRMYSYRMLRGFNSHFQICHTIHTLSLIRRKWWRRSKCFLKKDCDHRCHFSTLWINRNVSLVEIHLDELFMRIQERPKEPFFEILTVILIKETFPEIFIKIWPRDVIMTS